MTSPIARASPPLQGIARSATPVGPIRTQPDPFEGGVREHLVRCPYFSLDRLLLSGLASVGDADGARFTALIGLGGTATVSHGGQSYPVRLGQTLLLPAALKACPIAPEGGEAVVLTCTVP